MSPHFLLKWLEPHHPALAGLNIKTSGQGAVVREHAQQGITGMTLFQARDFNESFLAKLKARRAQDSLEVSYKLHLPPFLKYRAATLLAASGLSDLSVVYSPFLHLRAAAGRFYVRHQLRIASVDDSPVLLKVLKRGLEQRDHVQVVGQCNDSMKAVAMLREWQPDVVTMDIQMPNKDGVELVREIMASDRPLPIVMVSSLSPDEGSLVFEALNAGAFHYIQKPKLEDREAFDEQLHDCILEAAVGRRMPKTIVPAPKRMASTHYPKDLIWCLGSSTGGTQALTQIFTSLPDRIPPTLIVQHIPPVFSAAFANSLNNLCPFTVKEAQEGDIVKENHVYIAPGGKHMALVCGCSGGPITISLQDTEPVNRFKPSVDYMFAQVKALQGWRVVAGLLTGMGRDGAEGLLGLRQAGARTFAQDEDTSAVYGMPRAAAEIGAAEEIVALEDVGQTLMNLSPAAGFLKTG